VQRYWSDIERHRLYVSEYGIDLPDIRDWRWQDARAGRTHGHQRG
jgi:xylulose-5-phosphate/fructose-6-phosphate phosphoketolase